MALAASRALTDAIENDSGKLEPRGLPHTHADLAPLATVPWNEDIAALREARNKLRDMRKPAMLVALFPTLRGDVLAATFSQPEKWWYLSELAQFLGTSPSGLQRELKALVDGGILETRRDGSAPISRRTRSRRSFPSCAA